MGKIRVRTLGDEKKEKEDKKKAQQRAEIKKVSEEKAPQKETAEAKTAEAVSEPKAQAGAVEEKGEEKKSKKGQKKFSKKQGHSANYLAVAKLVDKNRKYALKEALEILPQLKRAKFDETVELHINTQETGVSGNFVLPHGTGKEVRIEIANQAEDPKHVEEIVKKVEGGLIDFDVLIATPDSMPKLAKVARFLGPRGLMPNPKSGTVTPKPSEVAKKFQGGQINFKTESKFPIIHCMVGKVSFGDKKLQDNIKATIAAVQMKNIKNVTLKSTMSPGVKLDIANL